MRQITSASHALVKHWRGLRTSRQARKSSQRLVLFGEDAVLELGPGVQVVSFFSTHKSWQAPEPFRKDPSPLFPHLSGEERFHITSAIWKKISGLNSEEGMGIEVSFKLPSFEEAMRREAGGYSSKLLIIDELGDPGNVGTLIRSAVAFGFYSIFFTSGSADPLNDKALRASKGLALKQELIQGSVEQCLELLEKRGYHLLAADAKGEALGSKKFKPQRALAIVVGNEARGVNPALLKQSMPVAIPMEQGVESLNAAVAGSLLMWAFRGEET